MSRIEYKNSGIFWQPFIPKSWHVTRLKYILKKLSREKGADDELLVCSNSGDIKKRGDSRLGLVANSNDIYQGVRSGDLLTHGMEPLLYQNLTECVLLLSMFAIVVKIKNMLRRICETWHLNKYLNLFLME